MQMGVGNTSRVGEHLKARAIMGVSSTLEFNSRMGFFMFFFPRVLGFLLVLLISETRRLLLFVAGGCCCRLHHQTYPQQSSDTPRDLGGWLRESWLIVEEGL